VGEEAVWPPLDVTGLELRMEIEARELELEVRKSQFISESIRLINNGQAPPPGYHPRQK